MTKSGISSNLRFRINSLWQAASRARFAFYDNEYEKYRGIKDISVLPNEDPRFTYNDGTFPAHSAFLKGLVKISNV